MFKSMVLFASLLMTLLISWLNLPFPAQALSEIEEVKWSAVDIPAEGRTGNWVLAPGSDVQHLTMARDGTLYCYARPSGRTILYLNPGMAAIPGLILVKSWKISSP